MAAAPDAVVCRRLTPRSATRRSRREGRRRGSPSGLAHARGRALPGEHQPEQVRRGAAARQHARAAVEAPAGVRDASQRTRVILGEGRRRRLHRTSRATGSSTPIASSAAAAGKQRRGVQVRDRARDRRAGSRRPRIGASSLEHLLERGALVRDTGRARRRPPASSAGVSGDRGPAARAARASASTTAFAAARSASCERGIGGDELHAPHLVSARHPDRWASRRSPGSMSVRAKIAAIAALLLAATPAAAPARGSETARAAATARGGESAGSAGGAALRGGTSPRRVPTARAAISARGASSPAASSPPASPSTASRRASWCAAAARSCCARASGTCARRLGAPA